jgi:hypothetical protein
VEVATLVHHAVTTDEPRLRYAVSWGGEVLLNGRAAMTDEQWVEMGAWERDDDYYADFEARFGLDLRP